MVGDGRCLGCAWPDHASGHQAARLGFGRASAPARPIMVRVSARTHTAQEANQLGGAVILPLIFLAVGQSTGLLLLLIIGAATLQLVFLA